MSVLEIEAVRPAWQERLSPRETEVMTCVARGGSNAEIAAELFIAVPTVKTHLAQLLRKTGVRDRVNLVVLAWSSEFMAAQGLMEAHRPRRTRCLRVVRTSRH